LPKRFGETFTLQLTRSRRLPTIPSKPDDAADKSSAAKQEPLSKTRQVLRSPALLALLVASILVLVIVVVHCVEGLSGKDSPDTWRFIVSGDSRNCGDVVVAAIAAQSVPQYHPSFYWHLGDLRAIYKIDEDMAAEAQKKGEPLSCKSYLKDAWPDFIKHQIAPFGTTRFYLGIGNHEVIPPKTREEFTTTFEDWLVTPRRYMEGVNSADSKRIAANSSPACQRSAKATYLSPLPYYHWAQSGVEFIYLDNSSGSFAYKTQSGGEDNSQVDWFDCILELAQNDPAIKTVVVGMHEVLPYSRANNHSMCDHPDNAAEAKSSGCQTGKHVYDALLKLKEKKRVYVLASHSHFYLEDVFAGSGLPGWIVGTAGAVRYSLPQGVQPGPGAQADVYGYLLGTVNRDGEIQFSFNQVKQADVPAAVLQRYPSGFPNWCFAYNSDHIEPWRRETTNRCGPALPTPTPTPSRPTAKPKK
jgi:hypothetical protein